MRGKVLIIALMFALPVLVKADGIPYPSVKPYISEEHQIVLAELKGDEMITTLDLGIKATPENMFSLLDETIYINQNNPVWLKTFQLTENFKPDSLCVSSYNFQYYNKPTVEVTINGERLYLYFPGRVVIQEDSSPYRKNYQETYCEFIGNDDFSNPQFVNVSEYFKPGEYNTVEIRAKKPDDSFNINRVYLQSGALSDNVKIIIPFKQKPKWIEIGGTGINIWELESVFGERNWYGYYGDKLLTATEAPDIAGKAMTIEKETASIASQTQVATDVSGKFEGTVSDYLQTFHASESREPIVIRLVEYDSGLEAYINDYAYVVELKGYPYELKRIVIKWAYDVDKEGFNYYYPLGTGQTWKKDISYTAIYVKLPEKYAVKTASIAGREEALANGYRYYRWKFVDSNPSDDLKISVAKTTIFDKWAYDLNTWLDRNKMVVAVSIFLLILLTIISIRQPRNIVGVEE